MTDLVVVTAGLFIGVGIGMILREQMIQQSNARSQAATNTLPLPQRLAQVQKQCFALLEQVEPGTQRSILITEPHFDLIHSGHTLWVFADVSAADWRVTQTDELNAVIALHARGTPRAPPASPTPSA